MKKLWRDMSRGDCSVILVLFLIALIGLFWQANAPTGARLIVGDGDQVSFTAELHQEQTVDLEGPLGVTRLNISDGAARILASPCPRKICISMGSVQRSGELLACVPNRILVRIEGVAEEGVDYDLLSR
ncbi:MAG: NusG domain II-containing protein [Desulfuromonadales bacterium]|nr:NusG domain II-containing protein [Desulfuromonadales bacterium]